MAVILNAALALGVIVNLFKGADLILRPPQRKQVQEAVETATLWLEELRPMRWRRHLSTPRGQKVILGICILECVAGLIIALIRQFEEGGISNVAEGLPAMAILVIPIALLIRYGPRSARWFFEPKSAWRFILRFAGLWVILFVIIVSREFLPAIIAYFFIATGYYPLTYGIIFFLCILPVLYYSAILHIAILIILCTLLIALLEGTLKIIRGVAWRVVEYDKGAYAALALLATIGLGILKIVIDARG